MCNKDFSVEFCDKKDRWAALYYGNSIVTTATKKKVPECSDKEQTPVESDSNGSDICWPLTWSSLPLILTCNCPHPWFTTLFSTAFLGSWFSPTSCYFNILPHFYSLPRRHCQPHLSTVPSYHSLTLPHPSPPYGVWGEGGLGFWMEVSNFRNCIVGWLLTGCHVTHQRPCCTHATLLLHILWCTQTQSHRPFSGAAGTPFSCSIHNYLNNLSESCKELD